MESSSSDDEFEEGNRQLKIEQLRNEERERSFSSSKPMNGRDKFGDIGNEVFEGIINYKFVFSYYYCLLSHLSNFIQFRSGISAKRRRPNKTIEKMVLPTSTMIRTFLPWRWHIFGDRCDIPAYYI